MRTRIALCALAALSLTACQKSGESSETSAAVVAAPAADASATASSSGAGRTAPPLAVSVPQLAYVYKYALAAPPDGVRSLIARHEAACWAAGPAMCQVTGSSLTEDGPDKVQGVLTLRAQPQWLRVFRQGLEADTRAVDGRMLATDTSSDDLSRTIVDTEAAIRAKTALRDRLEETLRTRSGKATDFFQMEQQLAEVQAEIDAARSNLANMRTRVVTSELRIDYRSEGVLAPSGTMAPLASAAEDVVEIFVGVLAFLIRALAFVTPVAGLAALVWLVGRNTERKPSRPPPGP